MNNERIVQNKAQKNDFEIIGTDTKSIVEVDTQTTNKNISQENTFGKSPKEIMTIAEVATYLGLTNTKTVQKYRKRKGLPSHKINATRVLYFKSEIDNWVIEQDLKNGGNNE